MVRIILSTLVFITFSSSAFAVGDPTRPQMGGESANMAKTATSRLVLSAIFSKGERRSAIINGKLYRKGDRVGNKRIIAIKNREVILANAENRTRLVLIEKIKH